MRILPEPERKPSIRRPIPHKNKNAAFFLTFQFDYTILKDSRERIPPPFAHRTWSVPS